MSVITPAPQPKSDIFREVEQLQNSFKNNESKVLVDNNKIYKNMKNSLIERNYNNLNAHISEKTKTKKVKLWNWVVAY